MQRALSGVAEFHPAIALPGYAHREAFGGKNRIATELPIWNMSELLEPATNSIVGEYNRT
jgi:hypothetical protein